VKLKYSIGLAAVLALTAAAALAPAAPASPYHRSCENAHSGGVLGTGNSVYVQSGPYGIRMSAANAARIARRLPPGDYGSRSTARDVPCYIASSVAASAGTAWLHWRHGQGSVSVVAYGEAGAVKLGRFFCRGRHINQTVRFPPLTYHYVVAETCAQGSGAGKIVTTFRIGTTSQ
jgi:hypothetical protein